MKTKSRKAIRPGTGRVERFNTLLSFHRRTTRQATARMRTETAAATMNDTRPLAETRSAINERRTLSPGTDSSIENQRADKVYGGMDLA
jgi:hypothetical protein